MLKVDGTLDFVIVENLDYNLLLGGVTTNFSDPDTIDEMYVAVQGSHVINQDLNEISTGGLSQTVLAVDSAVPQAPTLGDYDYDYITPSFSVDGTLPQSAIVTGTTSVTLWRSVNGLSTSQVSSVNVNPTYSLDFTISDPSISSVPIGAIVIYYAEAVNSQGSSAPSNSITFTTVEASSAPQNLSAIGVKNQDGTTQNVKCAFTNSAEVYGELTNPNDQYESAFYTVTIKDADNNVLSVQYPTYDEFQGVYSLTFDGIDWTTTSNFCEAFLTTWQTNGDLLVGATAVDGFSSGQVPFINNVNNLGTESVNWEGNLSSFDVSSSTLVNDAVLFSDQGGNIVTNHLPIPNPTTTGSSGFFTYTYSFIVELVYLEQALGLAVANTSGIGTAQLIEAP
jgi:hypothetical protein